METRRQDVHKVLAALERRSGAVPQLASRTLLVPSQVSTILDDLVEQKVVMRTTDQGQILFKLDRSAMRRRVEAL